MNAQRKVSHTISYTRDSAQCKRAEDEGTSMVQVNLQGDAVIVMASLLKKYSVLATKYLICTIWLDINVCLSYAGMPPYSAHKQSILKSCWVEPMIFMIFKSLHLMNCPSPPPFSKAYWSPSKTDALLEIPASPHASSFKSRRPTQIVHWE